MSDFVIALAGNPNTGKSTVFNALTGLKQHTGNWSGKTVESAEGFYKYCGKSFKVVDLPGIYSFYSESAEERAAKEYVCSKKADAVLVIADGCCLERNLSLCLQAMDIADDVVLCLNLMDEAQKHGISVDCEKLSELLGIPVIYTAARKGTGIEKIREIMYDIYCGNIKIYPTKADAACEECEKRSLKYMGIAADIAKKVVIQKNKKHFLDRADKIILSPEFGVPIIILMLCVIFVITVKLANYPSNLLFSFFGFMSEKIKTLLNSVPISQWVKSLLMDGVFNTTAFVVSVMLPPMAIFFPLFTFLEDCGFLPRIAFSMDGMFRRADAHGKQAITTMMAFGCNAAAVTNCRIIESRRERLMAILTNNFIPCNGRFPTIIVLTTAFLASGNSAKAAFVIFLFILSSFAIMLVVCKILSITLLKGMKSSFILELPPYRRPQMIKIVVRSILDRTVFVLGRAVTAAIPAGAIIWLLQNINVNGTSILINIAEFFNPFAQIMGLNGIILTAFIFGLPANEIVLPIIFMCISRGTALTEISNEAGFAALLAQNGWTYITAVCTILFSLNHFPCATTLLSIKKETGSMFWTAMAFAVPLLSGIVICICTNFMLNLFQLL